MISVAEKKNCCGCAACVQVCPKTCISMVEDEEGFCYPQVNTETCIHCNLCERVCPMLKSSETVCKKKNPQVYVAYNRNQDIRLASSSGGIFTPLANKILSEGGIVYGAAFDEEFFVQHIAVTNTQELELLRGSKYLQSCIKNSCKEVKKFLQEGKTILYSGTACQIAGLKAYLGTDYEKLYTIDVLCHGVPSPKLWKRYLESQEKIHGAAVKKVQFRQKKYSWKQYNLFIEFANDRVYEQNFWKDLFMRMFLNNICLRPSCHSCQFKGIERPSDITIGDCWGIENYMPEMDDDKGTSVVLAHTDKGSRFIQSISNELNLCVAELDKVLSPDSDSRRSVFEHPDRKAFFRSLNKGYSVEKLETYIKPSFGQRVLRKSKRIIMRLIKK